VTLQLKGKSGDTYRHEFEATTRTTIVESGGSRLISVRMTIETKVEGVKPGGRQALAQRIVRVRLGTSQDGQGGEFDSADQRQLEAARKNPDLAPILEVLRATMRYEQEPTGELRQVAGDKGGDAVFEQMVSQGNVLFPGKAVGVLERWDAGKISRQMSGLGRLDVDNEGVLLHVRVEDGERQAYVGVRESAKLAGDEEAGAEATLAAYKGGGVVVLGLDTGRIHRIDTMSEMTVRIREKGQTITLRVEGKTVMQEVR
jgi:hypothetical protein